MSIKVMTAVFDHSKSKLGARLVLLCMADIARDNGIGCKYGMKTIARKAGLSERGARDCVRELEKLGEVVTKRGGGNTRTNEYHIILPGIGNPADSAELIQGNPAEAAPLNPEAASGETNTKDVEGSKEPSRGSNEKKFSKEVRSSIWDSLTLATGSNPTTKTARGIRGKCVTELLEAGADPEQVEERAGRYHDIFPGATLTDLALVKHWGTLAPLTNGHRHRTPTFAELDAAGVVD